MFICKNKLGQLYNDHKLELTRYLSTKFRLTLTDSEDVVHATFSNLSRVKKQQRIENPRAYLYKTASNQVIDMLRSEDRFSNWVNSVISDPQTEDQTLFDPERISDACQQLEMMEKVIDGMSDKRRQILKMSRFENLSNVDIARQLGISEAAVRKHIAKALLEIKRGIQVGTCEVEFSE